MFLKSLFFCLMLHLICPCLFGQSRHQVLAVAFYNLENFFDPADDPKKFDEDFTADGSYHYTQQVFHQKAHNLATVIQQLGTTLTPDGAALIGAAEIENDHVLDTLIAQPEIKDRNYRYVHFESPDSRGIDVALLYNPKYFKVLNAEALPVNISEYAEKGGRTRDILHVQGILLGDTVHVLVNHWPSRRGGEVASAPLRVLAAATAKRFIDALMSKNPNAKVILMGDLNDNPVNASILKTLNAKKDKSEVGASGLYNPWIEFYKKGLGTLVYENAWHLFDQIMLSGGLLQSGNQWHYYKAEIFSKSFLINNSGAEKNAPHHSFASNNWINGYSDHFPVIVYLVR